MIKFKAFVATLTLLLASAAFAQQETSDCSVACNGEGAVQVDLAARCMCINKDHCFKVSIGSEGPSETTQGSGTLGEAKGCLYQTKATCSLGYDKDAIAMGIPENDATGKWIHKTRQCTDGGEIPTAGCIAVPCKYWQEVKDQMGKKLDVCGGGAPLSRNSQRPGGSGGGTSGNSNGGTQ